MVIIQELSDTGREFLTSHCQSLYLDGQCYELAIALHRGLGWPLVGLLQGKIIRHAVVRDPTREQYFFDARGFVSREELARPFGICVLQEIEETHLWEVRPISDLCIATARRMAEVLWPELPWRDSKVSKLTAFAAELEELCLKHKTWIRSALPACPPLLAEGEGDEGGYRLTPTDEGITYSIDRYLSH